MNLNGSDTEYFLAKDLVVFIRRYLTDTDSTAVLLAERAKISETTLYRIIGDTWQGYVPFTTADKIFTTMGIPQALNTLPKFARRNIYVSIEPPPTHYYEE